MNRWLTTILFLVGSVILTGIIPFTSFFRNVDTMVHELGHAVVTMLLSGRVLHIELYSNHGGVTYSYIEQGWRMIPLGLAGYITASLFAAFLFTLYAKGKLSVGYIVMSALAAVSLLFFVRNITGVIWLIGFIAVNTLAMYIPYASLRKFYYLLVSFICLEESVRGPLYLLYVSLTRPGAAGDAAGLSRATGVPAVIWCLLFVIVSLFCARTAIAAFIGKSRKKTQPQIGNSF